MNDFLKTDAESFFPGKPNKVGKLDFRYKIEIDDETIQKIVKFLQKDALRYWAGVTVGISDGLDGATAAALCLKAFGKEDVLGVIINLGHLPEHDEQEKLAVQTAEALGIRYKIYDGSKVYQELILAAESKGPFSEVNAGRWDELCRDFDCK
jgi:NH3-dependent NAD+ synthetase